MDNISSNETNLMGSIHSGIKFKTMFSSLFFWTQIKSCYSALTIVSSEDSRSPDAFFLYSVFMSGSHMSWQLLTRELETIWLNFQWRAPSPVFPQKTLETIPLLNLAAC